MKVNLSYLIIIIVLQTLLSCNNKAEKNTVSFEASNERQEAQIKNLLSRKVSKLAHDTLSVAEMSTMQDGDILLRKGYGFASDFIAVFLEEKYVITHCGLVLRDSLNPDKIYILHTVSNSEHDGMILEPLEVFIQDSQLNSLALVRTKFSKNEIQAALQKAKEFLAAKIPFDMDFNDYDDKHYYCVEMVRNAFLPIVGKDILPKRAFKMNKEVTHMSNFFDESFFSTIFNHNMAQY